MALAPGFGDPTADAQAVFRAVLAALSRPGLVRDLPAALRPPEPLTAELAAAALALADPDAPLWLDPVLAGVPDVAAYLRFHTGAPIVANPAEAAFALVSGADHLPPTDAFAPGTQDYPDRSTTVVLAVEWLAAASSSLSHSAREPAGALLPSRGEGPDGGPSARVHSDGSGTPPTPVGRVASARPPPRGGGMVHDMRPMFGVTGPGVKGVASFSASPLPPDFVARVAANHALFPRGVDWLLVGGGRVVGLPRSASLLHGPEAEAA